MENNETINVRYNNVGGEGDDASPQKVAKFVIVSSLRLCKAIKALLRRY